MAECIFPFPAWFEGYNFAKLRADFVAGLTAYYGLYASFWPPMNIREAKARGDMLVEKKTEEIVNDILKTKGW